MEVIIRELSEEEKRQYLADMREKALHDEVSAIAKGKAEEQKLIIEKMRKSGMTDEQIEAIFNQ